MNGIKASEFVSNFATEINDAVAKLEKLTGCDVLLVTKTSVGVGLGAGLRKYHASIKAIQKQHGCSWNKAKKVYANEKTDPVDATPSTGKKPVGFGKIMQKVMRKYARRIRWIMKTRGVGYSEARGIYTNEEKQG